MYIRNKVPFACHCWTLWGLNHIVCVQRCDPSWTLSSWSPASGPRLDQPKGGDDQSQHGRLIKVGNLRASYQKMLVCVIIKKLWPVFSTTKECLENSILPSSALGHTCLLPWFNYLLWDLELLKVLQLPVFQTTSGCHKIGYSTCKTCCHGNKVKLYDEYRMAKAVGAFMKWLDLISRSLVLRWPLETHSQRKWWGIGHENLVYIDGMLQYAALLYYPTP